MFSQIEAFYSLLCLIIFRGKGILIETEKSVGQKEMLDVMRS